MPKKNLTQSPTEQRVIIALLSAAAIVLNIFESALPLPLPGVRFGLANVFSMVALLFFGPAAALQVSLLRTLITFLFTGNVFALACTAAGLALSLPVMILLWRHCQQIFSVCGISVAAALAYNVGQLLAAAAIVNAPALLLYFPVLAVAALVSGYAVGWMANLLVRRMRLWLPAREGRDEA